jgi:hypothetical protein
MSSDKAGRGLVEDHSRLQLRRQKRKGLIESINFYETDVTITVDLTANFTLTEVSADRTAAPNY